MGMPKDIGIIDLMLGIPSPDPKPSYDFMRPLFRDAESLRSFEFPVEYMFKDVPKTGRREDYIKYTLEEMDKYGIERALIGVSSGDETSAQALRRTSPEQCSKDSRRWRESSCARPSVGRPPDGIGSVRRSRLSSFASLPSVRPVSSLPFRLRTGSPSRSQRSSCSATATLQRR